MNIFCSAATVYLWLLFAHVVLSWIPLFKPDWRPPEGLRPVLNIVYSLVDPPVNLLRRFIPPLRSGAMAIDLAFIVWFFIVIWVLRPALCQIGGS